MAIIRRDPDMKKMQTNIEIKTIRDVFEEALSKGISVYPFDIKGYLDQHTDIKVHYEQMADEKLSGYIEKRSVRYIIGVNKYHHINRQRFTMAHEFAHYIYDKNMLENGKKHYEEIFFESLYGKQLEKITVGLQRNENFSIEEREKRANIFASYLLIPEQQLESCLKETEDIEILATKFQVSPAAMYIRLKMR